MKVALAHVLDLVAAVILMGLAVSTVPHWQPPRATGPVAVVVVPGLAWADLTPAMVRGEMKSLATLGGRQLGAVIGSVDLEALPALVGARGRSVSTVAVADAEG